MLNRVHSPKPEWYEDFYASFLANSMKSYEEEVGAKLELMSYWNL